MYLLGVLSKRGTEKGKGVRVENPIKKAQTRLQYSFEWHFPFSNIPPECQLEYRNGLYQLSLSLKHFFSFPRSTLSLSARRNNGGPCQRSIFSPWYQIRALISLSLSIDTCTPLCVLIVSDFAAKTGRSSSKLRYPLRSATKSKEEKPMAAELTNSSVPKRWESLDYLVFPLYLVVFSLGHAVFAIIEGFSCPHGKNLFVDCSSISRLESR